MRDSCDRKDSESKIRSPVTLNPMAPEIVRLDLGTGARQVIASALDLPTGMTFGPDGNLYVSNWGFGPPNMGEILKVTLP